MAAGGACGCHGCWALIGVMIVCRQPMHAQRMAEKARREGVTLGHTIARPTHHGMRFAHMLRASPCHSTITFNATMPVLRQWAREVAPGQRTESSAHQHADGLMSATINTVICT